MLFIEFAPGKGNSIESGLECIQTISSIYGLFLLARGHRDSDPIHFTPSLSLSHSLSPLVNKKRIQFFPPSLSLSFSALLSMNLSKRWIRYNRSEIKKRRASSRKVYEVSRKLTRVGEEGEGSIFNLALFYES